MANILFDNAYFKLKEMSKLSCFSEVYNILNSLEAESIEEYKEACSFLGFSIGESGNIIIDNNNLLQLAALSMVFASVSEENAFFSIFFNQKRENINIKYLSGELFLYNGIDSEVELESEIEYRFIKTMRTINNYKIISFSSILEILKFYIDIEDIGISIGDYIQSVKRDGNLLEDFSLTETELMKENHSIGILNNLYTSKRLDVISFETIIKSLKGTL